MQARTGYIQRTKKRCGHGHRHPKACKILTAVTAQAKNALKNCADLKIVSLFGFDFLFSDAFRPYIQNLYTQLLMLILSGIYLWRLLPESGLIRRGVNEQSNSQSVTERPSGTVGHAVIVAMLL